MKYKRFMHMCIRLTNKMNYAKMQYEMIYIL